MAEIDSGNSIKTKTNNIVEFTTSPGISLSSAYAGKSPEARQALELLPNEIFPSSGSKSKAGAETSTNSLSTPLNPKK